MSHLHSFFEKKIYIINIITFSELPEPQRCLTKDDSGTAYDFCSEFFDDGCDHQGVLYIFSVLKKNNEML